MFRNVLVATDLAEGQVRAVLCARALALQERARLHILDRAAEHAANLLVLGVADRGGFDMMFFGSTANQVIGRAKCPVLTVRD